MMNCEVTLCSNLIIWCPEKYSYKYSLVIYTVINDNRLPLHIVTPRPHGLQTAAVCVQV